MGSLALGRVLNLPQPAPYVPPTSTIASNVPVAVAPAAITAPAPTASTTNPDVAAERVSEILQQKRGLAGTISTGWRGLIDADNNNNGNNSTLARKTLLGE